MPIKRQNHRQSPKQKDQYAKENQSVDRNYRIGEKMMPGTYCTIPHEDGDIQQHVEGWLKTVILTLAAKPVVPVEYVASNERCEYVVGANQTYGAAYEQLC